MLRLIFRSQTSFIRNSHPCDVRCSWGQSQCIWANVMNSSPPNFTENSLSKLRSMVMSYCWWKKSCNGRYIEIFHYVQGFIHPRWFSGRIPTINSTSRAKWSTIILLRPQIPRAHHLHCTGAVSAFLWGIPFNQVFISRCCLQHDPLQKHVKLFGSVFFVYIRIIGLGDLVYLHLASAVLWCRCFSKVS